jgi:hypothetical protein
MIARNKTFNPWPYGIVAVFVIFIATFAAVVAYISQHNMDLVSSDYYEQEIRYQGRLEELNRTAELRAGTQIAFDAATQRLRVSLPSVHAAKDLHGRLQLYRPSAAGLDREFKLAPDAAGNQDFDAKGLVPGNWKARLHWNAGGKNYFVEESLLVPPPAIASPP